LGKCSFAIFLALARHENEPELEKLLYQLFMFFLQKLQTAKYVSWKNVYGFQNCLNPLNWK